MSLLRRAPTTPEERQHKAELRAVRLRRTREARAATRQMEGPEAKYGLYVSLALVVASVYSYLSTDMITKYVTTKGKTHTVQATIVHPAQAIVLLAMAVIAAVTIIWRQRLVSGLSYIVAAFFGFQTPLPKSASDLTYLLFLAPVGYATWMLMFRMNKQQKEWLGEHYPAPTSSAAGGGASRNTSRRSGKAVSSGARSSSATAAQAPSRGHAPAGSGRYTPPRPKTRAAQRKS